MPYIESPSESTRPAKKVRKLVLCFDGTGNEFNGNTSDTNVVKIYDKLDRYDDNQYHYYQPGIGTYDINGGSINKSHLGRAKSKISKVIDQGIATSFDAHVIAGYKFIMNHFKPGSKIYMFGFSRGAFTARFLSRMINTVGLLSKGNDEMIPFAYSLYQDYEQARTTKQEFRKEEEDEETPLLDDRKVCDAENAKHKLENFKSTFCRKDKIYLPGNPKPTHPEIKVYFLGIFDCVSSVAVLETPFGRSPEPVSVVGTAEHVRHAVAVDEFRVKFKPALLHQDVHHEGSEALESVKEVWFPGNHGDVGGGWPAHEPESTSGLHDKLSKLQNWPKLQKFIAKVGRFFTTDKSHVATAHVEDDFYQMSDIPLSWMIRELELLGAKEEAYALRWSRRLDGFKEHFEEEHALAAPCHSTLSFSRGCNWLLVLMWRFMEYVPLFPRYELKDQGWKWQTFPPNMASARDIPKNARLHASLVSRLTDESRTMNKKKLYKPSNNHGSGPPCLTKGNLEKTKENEDKCGHKVDHTLYKFKDADA